MLLCNQCGFAAPPGPACPRCGAPAYVAPLPAPTPSPPRKLPSALSFWGVIFLIPMGIITWHYAQSHSLETVPPIEVTLGRLQCGTYECELSFLNGTRAWYFNAAGVRLFTIFAAVFVLLGVAGLRDYYADLGKR